MTLLWIAVRLLRTDQPRWWLAFGGVAGVALLNKDLVVLLAVALLIGMVVERRWALLRSPWLLAGGALTLLVAAPNLLWQADHGWPQRDMAEALSERLAGENRSTLIPLQLLFAGPLFVPVLWSGAKALATATWARPHRALLWTWIAGVVIAFITAGRPYYVLPLTTVILLVGFVDWAQRRTHPGADVDPGPQRGDHRRARGPRAPRGRGERHRRGERGRGRDGRLAGAGRPDRRGGPLAPARGAGARGPADRQLRRGRGDRPLRSRPAASPAPTPARTPTRTSASRPTTTRWWWPCGSTPPSSSRGSGRAPSWTASTTGSTSTTRCRASRSWCAATSRSPGREIWPDLRFLS